jgi:outer membrane protein
MQRTTRKRRGIALALAATAIAAAPIYVLSAQATLRTGAPLSAMDELARSVVANNPEIAAQRSQVEIARARMQAAEAGYLPTVEANGIVQKREIDIKNGGQGDARFVAAQAGIQTRVRVYDGDRTYNAVQVAKAELLSAEAALQGLTSDVLLELLTAAADVHSNRQIKRYSEEQSEAIAEQLRSTSRRLEFGESTRTDENLAKARLATAQAGILGATAELNVSGARFGAVSGQSATTVPPLPQLTALPSSLLQAQSLAATESPRLRVARLNADAGQKGVNFAKGALFPQLDAVGGYEFLTGGVANLFTGKLPNDRSALFGGIELRVPVFQPRDYAEIRRARAVRDQRLSQVDFAGVTVNEEVAASWMRWQSAKATIAAAQEAVDAIEQAAEGIKKESVGGNRTLVEVLDAQNELLTARISLERAIRNEFVARAGVLAATGRLNVENILAGRNQHMSVNMNRPEPSALGVRAAAAVKEAAAPDAPPRPATSALGSRPAASEQPGDTSQDGRPEVSALGLPTRNPR